MTLLARLSKQLIDFVLIIAITAVLALAVLYSAHWWYVTELARTNPQQDKQIAHVDASTLLKVGEILNFKESSFTNFPETKPAGVLRVGAFGDSFTYGDEVGETADFPSQLSKLFHDRGIANVEVLNFGSNWYGFGQAFVLWEDLAKKFDLDVVILGPSTFRPERDTRFNHTDNLYPYYIHSRFVVENGSIRRVDPIGSTINEKFQSYYGFWPSERYLRYDRNTPAFLQAILPTGKTLGNPFYYDARSERDEAADIYKLLVQKIMDSGVQLIIAEYGRFGWLNEALRAQANDRTCVAELPIIESFPYIAPEGHNSPLGNLLVAEQFFSLLTGVPIEAMTAKTVNPRRLRDDQRYTERVGLQVFDSISAKRGDQVIGEFLSLEFVPQPSSFITDRGFQSLLVLREPQGSPAEAIFLGLKQSPKPQFYIDHADENGVSSILLGAPRALGGLTMIDEIAVGGLDKGYREPEIYFSRGAAAEYFGHALTGGTISFRLGNLLLLKGAYDAGSDSYKLKPVNAELFILRSTLTSPLRPADLSGDVDLVLTKGKREIRTTLAEFQTETEQLRLFDQCQGGWRPPLRSVSLSGHPNQDSGSAFEAKAK